LSKKRKARKGWKWTLDVKHAQGGVEILKKPRPLILGKIPVRREKNDSKRFPVSKGLAVRDL